VTEIEIQTAVNDLFSGDIAKINSSGGRFPPQLSAGRGRQRMHEIDSSTRSAAPFGVNSALIKRQELAASVDEEF